MKRLEHTFSAIGLAETNIDPTNKDLFVLDDYTSFYQDINSAKFKGTGVALYIHNPLNASTLHDLCKTTDHFESHIY